MQEAVGSRAEWVVVIPVKRLDHAKTRLSTRPAPQRRALALAFALDTVRAALACADVVGVVVVTDDDEVRAAVAALGASWVPDEPDSGLNAALTHGAEVVRRGSPAASVAVLAADPPALRPAELGLALVAAAAVPRGFVADAAGTGTTLLTARPGCELDARFGERSRAAHAASGAVELHPGPVPGLRRDVDTEVDLWDAVRLGIGIASAPLLADGSASSRAMTETVATVRGHDVVARTGTVLLDDGTLLAYDAAAFDAGGLRLLRPGQRVRIRLDVERGAILALTLSTFDLP